MISLILRRQLGAIEPEIRRVWLSTVEKSPSVSLVGTRLRDVEDKGSTAGRHSVETLHRLVIEIHDWINVESGPGVALSPHQRRVLERAESLCLRQGRAVR